MERKWSMMFIMLFERFIASMKEIKFLSFSIPLMILAHREIVDIFMISLMRWKDDKEGSHSL